MKSHYPTTRGLAVLVLKVICMVLLPAASIAQANNLCANAATITPSASCATAGNNVAGSITGATTYTAIGSNCTTRPDVWYSFTAPAAYVTIQLSGANANTRFQVYTAASCGGTVTSVFCSGGLTGVVTGLTPGANYLVRVYNTTTTTTFNICVLTPPANDLCANAAPISVGATCSYTAGTLGANATYTNDATLSGCNNNTNDVWYSFVANTAATTVTLQAGAPANSRIQVLSGACGSYTSLYCGTSPANLTGLTPGQTYRFRIYSTNNSTGNFNVCVTDAPPANDNCGATATLLTSNPEPTCITTSSTLYASTASPTALAPCTGPVVTDVWFRFVAQSIHATVDLSSLGAGVVNPGMQLIANCGTPVTIACGTTTMTATSLTPGTTYYIRVYSTGGSAPTTPANGAFDICVTHPVPPAPPSNDECAGAITLQNNSGCNAVNFNILNATPSAVPIAPCTGPVSYDVWFKFTAAVANPTITLAGGANNFTGRALQLLRGDCGSLISVACGTNSIAATGLTIGNTYYIRVYSNSGVAAPTGNGQFTLCVASPNLPPKFGNSYVNISKKTAGGVVQPGDTLEIRMTINHTNGTLYYMRYLDSVPSNTEMLANTTDSIRVISNEGITYRRFTPAAGDDAATYIANPPAGHYQIRMNLAFGASTVTAPPNNSTTETASVSSAQMLNGDLPRSGTTSTLFGTSFRVRVTGVVGDTIVLGMGKFIYRTSTGGPDITLTATPYKILISDPMSLCVNSTGVNMSEEFGGTFGTGTTLNRTTDLAYPIQGYTYVNVSNLQGLGDGQYAIVKNISPRSGTDRNAERINGGCPITNGWLQAACAQRMHNGHWDIDGDHTGTTTSTGNIPLAEGVQGGYMLMVNADYVASETYRQTINNLCPNTYYEFSAWIRNICPTCGIDFNTGSNPPTPNQVPGVAPNLTFALDGVDRYNTGEVDHSTGWSKRGFVFVTGPSQNSATFTIRNNSQGGGGNDWVMDDISVATCLPNMQYSPTLNPVVCENNAFTLNDTIRSYFNNYRHHQWQSSTDGGVTWTDLGIARDSTPVFNPALNAWEYITSYTVPPANTSLGDSGTLYRVLVATSSDNLSNADCRVTDGISYITLSIQDCGIPLNTDLLSFSGKLTGDLAQLTWTTTTEEEAVQFRVERSSNGIDFTTIATVSGYNNGASLNNYTFVDPVPVSGKKYYRIVLVSPGNKKKFSRTIQLSRDLKGFNLASLINPFTDKLEFSVNVPKDGKIEALLTDMSGKVMKRVTYIVTEGVNSLVIPNTDALPGGMYIFQVNNKAEVITRKVIKKN